MEPLASWEEAWQCLQDGGVIVWIADGNRCYGALVGDAIRVRMPNATFKLSIQSFLSIYGNQTWYEYRGKPQVEVDEAKDEAYYRYWHK